MCVIQNCTRPDNNWEDGGVGRICQEHYDQFHDLMRRPPRTNLTPISIPDDLINDLIKLYVLMNNRELVLRQIRALNQTFRWTRFKSNYAQISAKLSEFEHKCWFPPTHLVACGILSNDAFLGLLRAGYMLKDVGAGATHGEFSHRLQWHAVMRIATKGFTTAMRDGWNHSPYELYSLLGEDPLYRPRGLWGALFDSGGEPTTFVNPANLDQAVRHHGTMGFLSGQLNTLYNRRQPIEQRSQAYSQAREAAQRNALPPANRPRLGVLGARIQADVAQQAYLKHKGFAVDNEATRILDELHLNTTSWANSCRLFHHQYAPVTLEGTNGALLMRVGDALILNEDIGRRRAGSRNRLLGDNEN